MSKPPAAPAAPPKALTQTQLSFLQVRVSNIEDRARTAISCSPKKPPPAVAAAQRVVDAWEADQREAQAKARAALAVAADGAREAILFQPADVALATVKAFQKNYTGGAAQ